MLSTFSGAIVEIIRSPDLSDAEIPPRDSAPTFFADAETAPALDSVAVPKLGLL